MTNEKKQSSTINLLSLNVEDQDLVASLRPLLRHGVGFIVCPDAFQQAPAYFTDEITSALSIC